jgi:hypothetical protein
MDLTLKLVVVALVIGALWWGFQPRYAFVVRIETGLLRVTRGKVTTAFLEALGRACSEVGVSDGWVGGVHRGQRVTLAFSRGIPVACQQRLRNLWILHG